MDISAMRQALIERYSPVIRNQRVDLMPNDQVYAIYHSLIERKDATVCGTNAPKRNRLHEPVKWEQLRMDI